MTLLTVPELKALVPETETLGSELLEPLLSATEYEINQAAGPLGTLAETHVAHRWSSLVLLRPAESIDTITVDGSTVDGDDYSHTAGSSVVYHATSSFRGRVVVTYTPVDDLALRKRVQADLIRLEQRVEIADDRASLLGRLAPPQELIVI